MLGYHKHNAMCTRLGPGKKNESGSGKHKLDGKTRTKHLGIFKIKARNRTSSGISLSVLVKFIKMQTGLGGRQGLLKRDRSKDENARWQASSKQTLSHGHAANLSPNELRWLVPEVTCPA